MYQSKYYTCEEIDERLLKGYYDDAVSKGYSGTFEQFKLELASQDIVNLDILNSHAGYTSAEAISKIAELYPTLSHTLTFIFFDKTYNRERRFKYKGSGNSSERASFVDNSHYVFTVGELNGDDGSIDIKGLISDVLYGFTGSAYITGSSGLYGGKLILFTDDMAHVVHQILFTSFLISDDGTKITNAHVDEKTFMYERFLNFASSTNQDREGNSVDRNDYSKWYHYDIADGVVSFNKLDSDLQSLITNLSKNALFAGIATPTTNPGTPDGPVFYIATEAGTYSNFDDISVADGEAVILEWKDGWTKKTTGLATQQQIDIAGVSISELEYYFKSDKPNVIEVIWKNASGYWNKSGVFTNSVYNDISEPINVSSYKYYGYLGYLTNNLSVVSVDENGNFTGEIIQVGRLSSSEAGVSLFVFKIPENVNYISLSSGNPYKTRTKLFQLKSPFLINIADNTEAVPQLINQVGNLEDEVYNKDIDFELTDDNKKQYIFVSKTGNYGNYLIFEVKENLIGSSITNQPLLYVEVRTEGTTKHIAVPSNKGIKFIYSESDITRYIISVNNNPNNFSGLLSISIYSPVNTNIYLSETHINFLNNQTANRLFKELYFNRELIDISFYDAFVIHLTLDAYSKTYRLQINVGKVGVPSTRLYLSPGFSSMEELIEYIEPLLNNKVLLFDKGLGGCIFEYEFFLSNCMRKNNSYSIVISEEATTSNIINKNVYEALKVLEAPKVTIAADYFSTSVMQQNYFDDINRSSLKEMVRNDVVVINQANVGLTETNSKAYPDLRIINSNGEIDTISSGLLDSSALINYRYFYWNTVQLSENVYDFSVIKDYITDAVNKKHRVAIRIFPSCLNGTYNTFEKDGITYKLSFPVYVAQKMSDNGSQFVAYDNNNNLLLDVNDEDVYTEYSKLITKFGEWLNTEKITYAGNEISIKEFILYIDFALLGPWGEGNWYNLKITNTVENILRYYNDIMTSIPDLLINTGCSLSSDEKSKELFYKVRQLKNDKGYFGTFLDNFGSKNPRLFDDSPVYKGKPIREWLIEFMNRGDFFTGEFAMFSNAYWDGNIPTYLYNELVMFKIPYIRIHNISYSSNSHLTAINKISKSIFYKINSCLSMVGFRYVYNLIYYKKNTDNSLNIGIELTNIGLNKCFFDIYELFFRVKNKDNNEITDIKIDFNLNNLMPKNTEPLEYSLGDGKVIESTISGLPENYSVSIIGKDKYNLQSPLYFSNYGRQEDGSYLLIE